MRDLTTEELRDGVSAETAIGVSGALRGLAEQMLEEHPQTHGQLACSEGCSHCCHQWVTVLPAEAFELAAEVRMMSVAEREAVVGRLREGAAYWREANVEGERTCAFLVGGRCSVYAARPTTCVTHHSYDAELCRVAAANGVGGFVPSCREVRSITAAMTLGVDDAYAKHGVRYRETLELSGATLAALESTPEDWIKGRRVFDGVMREDPTRSLARHNPRQDAVRHLDRLPTPDEWRRATGGEQ